MIIEIEIMKMTLEEVEKMVEELTEEEQEILLQRLIEKSDPIDSNIEKAWIDESVSRLHAMRDGSLDLIDEGEAFSEAFASLNEKNKA